MSGARTHTQSVVQILLQVTIKTEYYSPPRCLFWRADGAKQGKGPGVRGILLC